uniref:Uncharacterized protein n=1 Tax=Aegilops tauschii subsp. strangulata TaxID=200361 RepID=A0A453JNI4_AEGTS
MNFFHGSGDQQHSKSISAVWLGFLNSIISHNLHVTWTDMLCQFFPGSLQLTATVILLAYFTNNFCRRSLQVCFTCLGWNFGSWRKVA